MRVLRLAQLEFRRFRGPLSRLVPWVLALVPLLYGSLYLWSNWDPYGLLHRVPVAIVNEDKPVEVQGRTVDGGARLVRAVRESGNFDWHTSDAATAHDKLRTGDYFFTVTVPRGFSADLASSLSRKPRRATVHLELNDANGFIIGKAADQARLELQNQLAAAAQEVELRQVFGQGKELKDGLDKSADSAKELAGQSGNPAATGPGLQKLSQQLAQLSSAVPQAPEGQAAKEQARLLASPVDVTSANLHPAHLYGRGMTPFFFSIALWVFGLVGYLVLRPYNPRAVDEGRPATATLAGWLPTALLGVLGGLVLYAVVQLGLDLDAESPWLLVALVCLAALSFVALAQFFRTLLGSTGDLILLVLLMLQLTSCGGLYPVETTPAFFRALHPVMPMTYLVDGLRVTISGGQGSTLGLSFGVLAAYGAAALLATGLVLARGRRWSMSRLKPEIQF
ncbi:MULTISPECIES: YhgE/Pip family protein [unclassified Streptomyces]|uniref:YhgE/Pip domain-containing protein n=1 Tax=unclassified Streptomyces TaxID=2593676 RepID=UPI00081D6870|nr:MULTISPECIES: YhgE/Pip family protein [unclassified Streptomyces]MYR26422.1 ABC transporter permease [Streptomyces sp. SID4945]SCF02698.1 YhgE/Pip N-terminal domain-containing protein/YhgE/Pip C-terminal domain-containing protein [Streptomyces sp. LcepLS]